MYNGKQVDLFGATSTTGSTDTSNGVTPTGYTTWDGTQYDLSSYNMSDLSSTKQNHINNMIQATLHTYKTHGLFPSLTIAQSAKESGWGPTSGLATKGKAMFGIKAGSSWTGKVYSGKTFEYNSSGQKYNITDGFRAYDSYNEGIIDRANFLKSNSRYSKAGVFTASTPEEQAKAFQAAGYATDPNYASGLISLINSNNLKRFDSPNPPKEASNNAGTGDEAMFDPMTTDDLIQAYGNNAGMDPGTTTTGGTTPGGIPTSMNNFAYYKQGDPTWNESLINGHSISKGGCGPTTLAMIATQLSGKIITPVTMAKAAEKAGHWKGMAYWDLFPWFGDKFGLQTKVIGSNDLKTAKSELSKGNVIAVSGKTVKKGSHTPYTSGHIVPFIRLDGSNKIIVNDSRGPEYAHAYEDSGLAQGTTNHMRQAWSYSGQIKIPSDIEVSGDYTGGGGVATGPQTTLDTGTSSGSAPQVDELGVFGQLSNAVSNLVASMYNGKQVDLFGATSTTGSTDSSGGGLTSGQDISGISDYEQAVWTYFTTRGYTPQATAGIMGNMYQESGVNPTAIQGGGKGPAAGICQWENINTGGARWGILKQYADSKGTDWKDLQTQLEYLEMELVGDQSKVKVDKYTSTLVNKRGGLQALKSMTDAEGAMYFFEETFERAGKPNYPRRKKAVADYMAKFGGTAGTGGGYSTIIEPMSRIINKDDIYYSQNDETWNTTIYDGNMISKSGCGPTTLAMIATQLTGAEITPDMIARAAYEDGVWSDSSSWDIFPWFANQFGLEYKAVGSNDVQGMNSLLASDYKVAVSGKLHDKTSQRSPFTTEGHIVPIVGVQGTRYMINDPRGAAYKGEYEIEDIINPNSDMRAAYGFKATSKTKDYLANSRFNPELLAKQQEKEIQAEEEAIVALGTSDNRQFNASELYKNAGMGEGTTTSINHNIIRTFKPESISQAVSKPVSDIDVSVLSKLKGITQNVTNSVNQESEMGYIKACLESLNIAVEELKSINENTKQTAENVSNIKIYSANEPINQNAIKNTTNDKLNRLGMPNGDKSGRVQSKDTQEYKIARLIASFKK